MRHKPDYTNGIIALHNTDCMEVMAEYPDNYFDLAVVDPPYGIGFGEYNRTNKASNGERYKANKYKNSDWDGVRPNELYFIELERVAKARIIWGWNYFSDLLPPCKGFIYWDKMRDKMNHHDNRSDGEVAFCSVRGLARSFKYMWDGNRYGFENNIQGVGKPTIRIHPTQKPVKLYDWIFHNYSEPGQRILDTHLGSGSSAIAAHYADMKEFVGCEIDNQYFQDAKKRIDQQTAQITLGI